MGILILKRKKMLQKKDEKIVEADSILKKSYEFLRISEELFVDNYLIVSFKNELESELDAIKESAPLIATDNLKRLINEFKEISKKYSEKFDIKKDEGELKFLSNEFLGDSYNIKAIDKRLYSVKSKLVDKKFYIIKENNMKPYALEVFSKLYYGGYKNVIIKAVREETRARIEFEDPLAGKSVSGLSFSKRCIKSYVPPLEQVFQDLNFIEYKKKRFEKIEKNGETFYIRELQERGEHTYLIMDDN